MLYLGEISAILAAACWTVATSIFEDLGKTVSALSLNFYKALFGLFYLMIFAFFTNGYIIPLDIPENAMLWLVLSGFIGLVLGDFFILEAILLINARVVLLIYACSPPMSAILAYFILGQNMNFFQIIGMLVTLAGISLVVFNMNSEDNKKLKITLNYPFKGVLFAVLGSFMQAFSYVIGKLGLDGVEASDATLIRVGVAVIGISIIIILRGNSKKAASYLKNKTFVPKMLIGSFFAVFLGITFLLLAAKHTSAGVASTLSSLAPIMILPVAYFIKKQSVKSKEVIGAVIGVLGVGLMFF